MGFGLNIAICICDMANNITNINGFKDNIHCMINTYVFIDVFFFACVFTIESPAELW